MVVHQNVSMHGEAMLVGRPPEDLVEEREVGRAAEDRRPIVAALDNVQRQIGSEEARHTGHVRRVSIVRTASHRPKGRGAGKSEKSTLTLLFGWAGKSEKSTLTLL